MTTYVRNNAEGMTAEELEEYLKMIQQQELTADFGAIPPPEIPAYVPPPAVKPRQFLPDDGMGLNPARTVGSFPPINLRPQVAAQTTAPNVQPTAPSVLNPGESLLAQMQRRASGESLGERYVLPI